MFRNGTRNSLGAQRLRIFLGEASEEAMIPWQVRLKGPWECGGSLVTMSTVVTAAHCLTDNDTVSSAEQWTVSAGHIYRREGLYKRERGVQERQLARIIVHP